MRDVASLCITDLENKVKELPEFAEKAFIVYDQEVMLGTTQGLQYPCLGVVYEGIIGYKGNAGQAAELSASLILLAGDKEAETRGNEDKTSIVLLLDKIRKTIINTAAPTGHKWEFVMEIPLDIDTKGLGYYMKWKTNTALT